MMNPFEEKEVAENYDGWYQTKVGYIYDYLEKKTIANLLKHKKRGRMLEIGSGTGHWSRFFSKMGFEVIGVEKSKHMYDISKRKRIKNANFLNEDIFNYNPDKKFDCAAFITTLEFLENDKKAVNHVINLLADNGFILFGVLNKNSFLGQQRKKEKNIFTDARFYTQDEIKEIFDPHGEITIKTCAYPSPKFINYYAIIELIKKMFNFKNGNFIAGRVDL
ncbi:MAG: class I SAM-dependent methyltransferase [Candidatus Mcinerneyibacterium aminivorans]|uniref:Class I SAM-dependent methyltransferase n=1 Tax=Candidatus Mcinerneyibacterium aminivorans TaxID=2703815 RepID=A0A5D0MD14_9BACT|nr:MAG: class I SAM-dependent methyltransferase [Candidatus Mcinerneyibacterium aminivorans]